MKRLLKLLSVLVCVASLLLLTQNIALAASYDVKKITDNDDYVDWYPQINNDGQVVWEVWDGIDLENLDIYLYDPATSSTTRITDNSNIDASPQINNSGQVVWTGADGVNYDIYLYDSETFIIKNISQNSGFDDFSQINNSGKVVWQGEDGNDDEIYLYDTVTSSTIQITDNGEGDYSPKINNGGQIVWHGWDFDHEIYLYDPATSSTTQITDNGETDWGQQISDNGQVVWCGFDGIDYEIYLYDIETASTIQITDNSYDDDAPQINNSGQVVWTGSDGDDWEIYLYDIAASSTTQITDDSYSYYAPQINNNGQVVWFGGSNNTDSDDNEIYLYDTATSLKTQITDDSNYDSTPQINDQGQIVWHGSDGNDIEIFLAAPVFEDPTPPETTIELSGTLGNNDWYTSDVEVALSAEDEEGGSGVDSTEYSLDGTTWNTYEGIFTISAEGIIEVSYRSTDNAGNEEPTKTEVMKIDKTRPITGNPTPADGMSINNPRPTISATYSDSISGIDASSVKVSLDGEDKTSTCTITDSSFTFTPSSDLSTGTHTVTLEVKDSAGNTKTETWSFTITTTKPELSTTMSKAYWAPTDNCDTAYEAWQNKELSVDYSIKNTGDGSAYNTEVKNIVATTSSGEIIILTPQPIMLGQIAPGESKTATIVFKLPPGTARFHVSFSTTCEDVGGAVIDS